MPSAVPFLNRFRPFGLLPAKRRPRVRRGFSDLFGNVERLERRSLLSALSLGPVSLNRLDEHVAAIVEPAVRIESTPTALDLVSNARNVAVEARLESETTAKHEITTRVEVEVNLNREPARHNLFVAAVPSSVAVTPTWMIAITASGNARNVQSLAVVLAHRFTEFGDATDSRADAFINANRFVASRANPVGFESGPASFVNLVARSRIDSDRDDELPRTASNVVSTQVVVRQEKLSDHVRRGDSGDVTVVAASRIPQEVVAPRTTSVVLTSPESATPSQRTNATAGGDQPVLPVEIQTQSTVAMGSRTDQRFSQIAGLLDAGMMSPRVVATTALAPLTFSSREAELLVWHSGAIAGERSTDESPVKTIITDSLTVEEGPPPTIVSSDAEATRAWSAEPAPFTPVAAGMLPFEPEPGWWSGWFGDPRLWIASALAVVSGFAVWRRKGKWRLWA